MKKKQFITPWFDICNISKCDVITASLINSNDKLDGGDYGDVSAFDDYGL